MGKDLKGKELGVGISQTKRGDYTARFTDKFGKRQQKYFKKLYECKKWLADAQYADEHSNLDKPQDMIVDAWFEYWIDVKKRTVRPNTVRNYTERYQHNIKPLIGDKMLTTINSIHCQAIMNKMADNGYKSTTIYQARITLYNMLEYAYQSEVIVKNPCTKMVKYDIGKETTKKSAITIENQIKFLKIIAGSSYEYQFKFMLQTGLRTGEMIALKWSDVDFDKRLLTIERTTEYRHSTQEWRTGPPKSKSGYRTIPLTDEAISLLKLQKIKNSTFPLIHYEWKDTIFLCKKGTPVKNSTYDTALFKYCDKANIPRFSMHILRHTFATRCIEAGMKPKTLQTILGHSNIGITMNLYVHTTEDEKILEMDSIAKHLKVV